MFLLFYFMTFLWSAATLTSNLLSGCIVCESALETIFLRIKQRARDLDVCCVVILNLTSNLARLHE